MNLTLTLDSRGVERRRTRSASLTDIFVRGHEIRDLAVRPHERIALLRLFLCVAHAALDGPRNRDEWEDCLARLPAAAEDYLQRCRPAFELFGDGQRFLQVPNLKGTKASDDAGNSVSKLDMALATGKNSTLFDNSGGGGRAFAPEQLALMLLTFQCFSLQTPFGVAIWNGKPTRGSPSKDNPTGAAKNGKTYAGDAPCVGGGMIHAIVRQESLLQTIRANLPTRNLSWACQDTRAGVAGVGEATDRSRRRSHRTHLFGPSGSVHTCDPPF